MNIAPLMAIATEIQIVHHMATRDAFVSVDDLAEALEKSDAAIEDALLTLEDAGIVYYADRGPGWALRDSFCELAIVARAREVLLTEGEQ